MEAIDTAKKLKLRIIFLDLTRQNHQAMKFYKKHGFRPAGKIKCFYDNQKEPDAVIMSLET